jgi:hypothetical protein
MRPRPPVPAGARSSVAGPSRQAVARTPQSDAAARYAFARKSVWILRIFLSVPK